MMIASSLVKLKSDDIMLLIKMVWISYLCMELIRKIC